MVLGICTLWWIPAVVTLGLNLLGYLMQRQLVAKIHAPNFPIISMLITLCSPAQKLCRNS
jgi:hypothetical protein